jgi:hypothetical protein
MRLRRNRAAVNESASAGIHGLVQGEDNVIELRVEHEDPVISPSFDALFLDLHDRLYRALYFVTGSFEDAEELMQDAFLKLWERWDSIETIAEPTAYLFRVALNGSGCAHDAPASPLANSFPSPHLEIRSMRSTSGRTSGRCSSDSRRVSEQHSC